MVSYMNGEKRREERREGGVVSGGVGNNTLGTLAADCINFFLYYVVYSRGCG